MKRNLGLITAISAITLLTSCGGGGGLGDHGSPSTPPTVVSIRAQDSRVTLSWPTQAGVEYWVFSAPAPGVTPENCSSIPAIFTNQGFESCRTAVNVLSPHTFTGLTNGVTYSFSVNGRVNGGPGGPGTQAVQAIPRIAGNSWIVNAPSIASDLRGITYGVSFTIDPNTNNIGYSNVYIAVGANGALMMSLEGTIWGALTNPVPSANLNAVTYNNALGLFAAVGANGVILTSLDGRNWGTQFSGTSNDLYSISSDSGRFVAVGANGTMIISDNGVNWTSISTGTTNNLNSVTYGTNAFGAAMYLVVGDSGTILYSTDTANWTQANSSSSSTLNSVVNGFNNSTLNSVFVAVGNAGTLLYSLDGTTWTAQSPFTSANLNAVSFGRIFVAGDNSGNTYSSLDGLTWRSTNQFTTLPIYGMTRGGAYSGFGIFDYAAVGAGGLTMLAD